MRLIQQDQYLNKSQQQRSKAEQWLYNQKLNLALSKFEEQMYVKTVRFTLAMIVFMLALGAWLCCWFSLVFSWLFRVLPFF